MRKKLLLCAAMLAAVLLLSAAPAWALINISGQWRGSWTCDTVPCRGKSGSMAAKMKQSEDGTVTGSFVLANTIRGTLNCTLSNASIIGERFLGHLQCGLYKFDIVSIARGNTINGSFDSYDSGHGTFQIGR